MSTINAAISCAFCFIVLITAGSLNADAARIGPLLQKELASKRAEKLPIIVRLNDPFDAQTLAVTTRSKGADRAQQRAKLVRALKSHAQVRQQPLQRFLRSKGIKNPKQLWLINGLALQATSSQIEELAGLPYIASIMSDAVLEAPQLVAAPLAATPGGNIDLIRAPELWAMGVTGVGVTVAIMDTGVDLYHPDIGPRWRGGSNSWFDPHGEHPDIPTDLDGHGTQVAGIVLGGDNGGTAIGVAPDAQWIGVKIFNDAGSALTSDIHAGFQWLLDPDGTPETDDAPDLVNNSWGFDMNPGVCNESARVFSPDIQALQAAGISVVFSAGNTGPSPDSSVAPANYSESFAVGATGSPLSPTEIWSSSARGPSACDGSIYPEIVAPGFSIWTSDLTAGGAFPNSYASVTGTSFAAPHVSGTMALLLSAFPGASDGMLEAAFLASAVDLGANGEDNTYGYGLIDGLSAFNRLSDLFNVEGSVLVPNGGEVWTKGSSHLVRWVTHSSADSYNLFYFDEDNTPHFIANVAFDDKFLWTLPFDLPAGVGKRLRVTSLSGTSPVSFDWSDKPFLIASDLSPNGGESLKKGLSYDLNWSPVAGADNYNLFYFDADDTPHFIARVGNQTSYQWTVPEEAFLGSGKRFRVTPFAGTQKIQDQIQWSDGTFSIIPAIFPAGGETLKKGFTYDLSWSPVPGADSYNLFYFDADGTPNFIANVEGVSNHLWTIPEEALAGSGKRFRVTPFAGTQKLQSQIQWSGTFSIIPTLFPAGGESLQKGHSYELSWSSVPSADNYNLFYFDADGTPHFIAKVGNITTLPWVVPDDASTGSGKRFRVTPFSNEFRLSEGIQWSGSFEIIPQ